MDASSLAGEDGALLLSDARFVVFKREMAKKLAEISGSSLRQSLFIDAIRDDTRPKPEALPN